MRGPRDRRLNFKAQMWTPEEAIPAGVRARIDALERRDPPAPIGAFLAAFLEIVSELKLADRTGWVDRDVPRPESIADHMYRMSIICFLTADERLDKGKCQQIALVHDMAEALVGDITPYDETCDKEEKHRREQAAMVYLRSLISRFNPKAGEQIYELWCDYEFQRNVEARFVKDVDKFEFLSQVSEYSRKYPGIDLEEMRGARALVKTDEVKAWADDLEVYENAA